MRSPLALLRLTPFDSFDCAQHLDQVAAQPADAMPPPSLAACLQGAPRVPDGFFEYCQENDVPVMGICYGMQVSCCWLMFCCAGLVFCVGGWVLLVVHQLCSCPPTPTPTLPSLPSPHLHTSAARFPLAGWRGEAGRGFPCLHLPATLPPLSHLSSSCSALHSSLSTSWAAR